VGGCYRRYHTAMMRTVVTGKLRASMYHAQERMKAALHAVHENFQPGMTVSDADNLVRKIISQNDVGARLVTRSGYSIGIAFPPSWDEGYILSLKQGESTILEEGMTFHIIPWMWGVDGDKTCGISDTIYITKDGCKSFFTLDRDFRVNPHEPASLPNMAQTNKLPDKSLPKQELAAVKTLHAGSDDNSPAQNNKARPSRQPDDKENK